MTAVEFGNLCFNAQNAEQSILLVTAPKSAYPSIDEFVSGALAFLEKDCEWCDNWSDTYKSRAYLPVTDEERQWMKSRLDAMGERVRIRYEPVVYAAHILPPKWNEMTLAIETETEYIFFLWTTSA